MCAAIATVSTTVIDIRAKAREAKLHSVAGYDALAPAMQELQGLSEEAQSWVDLAHKRIHHLENTNADLEKRMIRLEGYVEALGRRRHLPKPPAPVKELLSDKKPTLPDKRSKKPVRLVPDDIQQARSFQKQRDRLDCDKDDPLCGQAE